MFGLFKKKGNKDYYQPYQIENGEQHEKINQIFDKYLVEMDSYARIDRAKLADEWSNLISNFTERQIGERLKHSWLRQILQKLDHRYQAVESKNFILITSQDNKHTSLFLKSIENIKLRIINSLSQILENTYQEKFIIILFEDEEDYYQYISYYYPKEGKFAHSSGCFLNDALPHFTLPMTDMSSIESVIAHELTHAMVSHLPIPVWLNEGLAVNMEVAITGYNPHRLNAQRHYKHQNYWGESEIQEFWSGESFSRADEGNELSYQLAQLIVRSLAEDPKTFYPLVINADQTDGGESSFINQLGYSLGDVIENILGEGDWAPNPTKWNLQ